MSFATACRLVSLIVLSPLQSTGRAHEPIVRGAIYNDHALACVRDSKLGVALLQARLPDGEPKKPIPYIGSTHELLQWRIHVGHLWHNTRFSREPLFTDYVHRFNLPKLLTMGVPQTGRVAHPPENPQSIVSGWGPLGHLGMLRRGHVEFPVIVHYDYHPISEERLDLFVLCNTSAIVAKDNKGSATIDGDLETPHWNLKVYRYDALWGPNPLARDKMTWIDGKWRERESLVVEFKEAFHVFMSHKDYYFVTESGRVYMSPLNGKTARRKMQPMWIAAQKPVTHVLTDVDGKIPNLTYAFGKVDSAAASKGRDRFFFELHGSNAKPVYFSTADLKPSQLQEPLKTVFEYAALLRERARTKPATPKER